MPRLDVVIFGGGGAGLWLLDALRTRGYRSVLLEADRLGRGQTACCQGIIHGGLKYTLDGVLSGSAAAIRDMPALWRDCLAGHRSPDLTRTRVRAEHCFLWRTESFRSRLGMIGARIGLRVAPRSVRATERPAVLAACPGTVARVAEQVIDPISLLADLARRHADTILKIDPDEGLELSLDGPGQVSAIELARPGGGPERRLEPRAVVFTAGAGNEALCDAAGVPRIGRQQRRPLHMLMMRGDLPQLNGHCVDGGGTRVTITADTDTAGRTVWQVGGEVSERGVEMEQPGRRDPRRPAGPRPRGRGVVVAQDRPGRGGIVRAQARRRHGRRRGQRVRLLADQARPGPASRRADRRRTWFAGRGARPGCGNRV